MYPQHYLHSNEKGSMMILVGMLLPVLLVIAGFALDVGNLYLEKTKIQTAVDAAALGGGQELPSTYQATLEAQDYITMNGETLDNTTITFNDTSEINVEINKQVPTFFLGLIGIYNVEVSSSATATLAGGGGAFDYAIFSGSESSNLSINGSDLYVKGSIHSNKKLYINGSSNTVTQAVEAVNKVTINGSDNDIGSKMPYSPVVDMPDYSAAIEVAAAAANQVYIGNKTINASNITSDPMYVTGKIYVNGSDFNATGALLADGNITINGSGAAGGDAQVCFYSKNGNITLNGSNMTLNGVVYAPKGKIYINGSNTTVHGCVVGNKVYINGSNFTVNRTDYPITSLPYQSIKLTK